MTVKQSLQNLLKENVDMSVNKHLKYLLENVEENQLIYKLCSAPGIIIDNNILHLWYHQGVGFTCRNNLVERYGRLPICNRIERFLNNEISKP